MSTTTPTPSTQEKAIFQFLMKQAAVRPGDFLENYKGKQAPEYWEKFWAVYAAIRIQDYDFLLRFQEEHESDEVDGDGNDFDLLNAYENYVYYLENPEDEKRLGAAYDCLALADGFISPLLEEAFDALHSLIPFPKNDGDEPRETLKNFYTEQLFVPASSYSIQAIRQRVNRTKSRLEWRLEIESLTEEFMYICVDSMLHLPEDFKGLDRVVLPDFILVEDGRKLTCRGMRKPEEDTYGLWLSVEEGENDVFPLENIKSMETYHAVAVALLKAIDGAREWMDED